MAKTASFEWEHNPNYLIVSTPELQERCKKYYVNPVSSYCVLFKCQIY